MTAYLVLDFSVHDLRGFLPYVAAIPAFIEKHGGRYVVRGEPPTVIEGDWSPERLVILEFPSRAAATGSWRTPRRRTCSPCGIGPRRAGWCWWTGRRRALRSPEHRRLPPHSCHPGKRGALVRDPGGA